MTGSVKRKDMHAFIWHISLLKHETHYSIFLSYFSPVLYLLRLTKKIVHRYFESQFNPTIDSLSSHFYTNVMIRKLNKFGAKDSNSWRW